MTDLDIWHAIRQLRADLDPLRTADASGVTVSYAPTYDGSTPGATTYTTQVGAYVRMGPIVTATGIVVWSAATGTGNARVGLPFAAVATTNLDYGGSCSLASVTFTNSTPTVELVFSNSFFQMRSPLTNAAGALVQTEAAGQIVFTVVYFVA